MQISLRYRTSRTLNLNNSMAFCAEIHVFDLLVFHVFPIFFGIDFCIDFYLLFDIFYHHFWSRKLRKIRYFRHQFFGGFLDIVFSILEPKLSQNGSKKTSGAGTILASKINTFPQGVLLEVPGSFWLPFGSILVALGTLLAPF